MRSAACVFSCMSCIVSVLTLDFRRTCLALLQVLQQSYFFDSGVKTMGVSATMHGISNKFLLVGTLSDQVGLYAPVS